MEYYQKFYQVLDAFEKADVDYILVGGFAMILYGLPRVTEDIDIFVNNTEDNISKLKSALFSVFKDNSITEISSDMLDEYAVIRYGSHEGFYIDILVRLGETFEYNDLIATVRTIDGHKIKIATVETLYKMKKDTIRHIDKSDAVYLLELLEKGKRE